MKWFKVDWIWCSYINDMIRYDALKWFEVVWEWCSKMVRGRLDMMQLGGSW